MTDKLKLISTPSETSTLLPSNTNNSSDGPLHQDDTAAIFSWQHPWLFSLSVTTLVLLPTLLGSIHFLCSLTSRLYPATLHVAHMFAALISAGIHTSSKTPSRLVTSIFCILDVYLCHSIYPSFTYYLENSFVDIDGITIHEWRGFHNQLKLLKLGMWLVVILRLLLGCVIWSWLITAWLHLKGIHSGLQRIKRISLLKYLQTWAYTKILKERTTLKGRLFNLFVVLSLLSLIPLSFCLVSCFQYLWWHPEGIERPLGCCDDLDPTECALPFPSFHHMRPDPYSLTGWRVNLQGNSLPPMKSHLTMDLSFLNDLDGFSPMAPILFYFDGLRESFEAQQHFLNSAAYANLPYNFEDSITDRSITLLWDVEDGKLVPHTARVDYLDIEKPIILIVPSKPLKHATHYGVVLVNATGSSGHLLPPTFGMQRLWEDNSTMRCSSDTQRLQRYQQVLLPSLKSAAPWVRFESDQQPFPQLMFDFVTMSDDSLQPIRTIRDSTIQEIATWDSHQVDITKIVNSKCNNNKTLVARAIHGFLTVPWWLESESRDSFLSSTAVNNGKSNGVGQAKFSVYVPCSLYAAAVNDTTRIQRPLRAIIEYGHGVFYNRGEASEYSLLRIAEDQGYLVIAMDWRGMSSFDMPVVIRSLLATPDLIQATRDNLIQGYANKIVLQHFSQNGLLNQEWLQFSYKDKQQYSIPTYNSKTPTRIFYGNSQGGILGAAYTALLGPTGWIDRGILGTPGTSFSLVMYKSKSFTLYDALLMQNFYSNRQIRIVLSVLQLAWDAVEPSSMLASPITEIFPPMLLQSGLGDPVIPTLATEALARAYNASILPNNPRSQIFGISKMSATNDTDKTPHVVWTELLYASEYQTTPMNNDDNAMTNTIHECLRQDCALIGQVVEFINYGRIIDPCLNDNCLRKTIPCYMKGRKSTKLSNWTCNYEHLCS